MNDAQNKINLMACFEDEEWLKEAIRIEEECGGEISAGYGFGTSLGQFYQNPDRYVPYDRMRSLVMSKNRDALFF